MKKTLLILSISLSIHTGIHSQDLYINGGKDTCIPNNDYVAILEMCYTALYCDTIIQNKNQIINNLDKLIIENNSKIAIMESKIKNDKKIIIKYTACSLIFGLLLGLIF